MTKTDRL